MDEDRDAKFFEEDFIDDGLELDGGEGDFEEEEEI